MSFDHFCKITGGGWHEMKAAIFSPVSYLGPAKRGTWPVPAEPYASEAAMHSMQLSLDQFELADEVGFDWVTVAEHHYAPLSITPNPMIMAGALTQRVRRAKIALLGPTVPILNPVRVAEEFAMVDNLCGGRVVAGMLRGTSNEYTTYNINPAESRERLEEALALIVRAWTEPQPFGWQGRYYEFRSVSIWPRPVQQPHPPIFVSGSSPESGEFAARNRIRLGLAFTTVPLARDAARYYREQAAAAGWEPAPEDVLYRVAAHVADSDEEAMEDLERAEEASRASGAGATSFSRANPGLDEAAARAGYYGRDTRVQRSRLERRPLHERIEQGQLVAGGPETALKQIRRIRDEIGAGILEVIFQPGSPYQPLARARTMKTIELFGTKVLPRMREL
ncbi:MAG: LLM class flavin-dependent oxidoreductase [Streptosporangiales bacterium]|nr:LLM class flavin-dependent oxidoreductase [Streptosporangiales bacterium]